MHSTLTPLKTGQPIPYPPPLQYAEPDWTRIPGYRTVTTADWENATWQRKHSIKNLGELKNVLGDLLPDTLLESVAQDQQQRATMSMLLPPHMLNTMNVADLWRIRGQGDRLRQEDGHRRAAHRGQGPADGQHRQSEHHQSRRMQ